jgi:hypothetical protein
MRRGANRRRWAAARRTAAVLTLVAATAGCFSVATRIGLSIETLQIKPERLGARIDTNEIGRYGNVFSSGTDLGVTVVNFPYGTTLQLGDARAKVDRERVTVKASVREALGQAELGDWLRTKEEQREATFEPGLKLTVVSRFGKEVSCKLPPLALADFESSLIAGFSLSKGEPFTFGDDDEAPKRARGGLLVATDRQGGRSLWAFGKVERLVDADWIAFEAVDESSVTCGGYYDPTDRANWNPSGAKSTRSVEFAVKNSVLAVYERRTGAKVTTLTLKADRCPQSYDGDKSTLRVPEPDLVSALAKLVEARGR